MVRVRARRARAGAAGASRTIASTVRGFPTTHLNSDQARYLLCDRLNIPLPPPIVNGPPYHCHPDCKTDRKSRLACPHGYHQTMCPKFWLTSVRHNEWLHFLKLTLQKWMGYSCIEGNYLHHSADTCKKVDLLIHALDRPDDHPVMADPTFICVQSKAYLPRASRDLPKLLKSREVDKDDKHGPGCRGIEREFVPMVLTVQGSAAPCFWAWWDKAWLRALHRHIATGGTSLRYLNPPSPCRIDDR